MLFVITFDEHGGMYDHVAPPLSVAPDPIKSKHGFDFKRLGVRVPTILVSPYTYTRVTTNHVTSTGTVFRAPVGSDCDFDHASFIATMLKWAGVEPSSADLGDRVAVAPTFGATRPCGPTGIGGCDAFMKLCLSSSGCESRPAKGEPARVGSKPCASSRNGVGDA